MVLLLGCLYSCNNNNGSITNNSISSDPSIMLNKDSVMISIQPGGAYNLTINVEGESVVTGQFNKPVSYSFLDLARKCSDKNEIALAAVNNNNLISLRVKVDDAIDTLATYSIEPYFDEESTFSISGQCAPLVSAYSNPTQTVDLKKWLFRRKTHLDDEQIRVFSGLVNQLSLNNSKEYITNSAVPVLHSFNGIKYNVRSNLEGDHFVLFACSSVKDIDEFVEHIVANDFVFCSNNVSGSMDCYRKSESNGYMCISLIAIKNDWSYKIQPLGLVAIDNLAPNERVNNSNISSFIFPNDIVVKLPSNLPEIYGYCDVTCTNGGGNGIECNVSFHINYSGDVRSVTIKRTKKLCDSFFHKVENRVINVKDVSNPYSFTMMMHLEDGDNFIPVIVEDNHGNKREYELNLQATFVRSDVPNIEIENNNYIDNY